MSGDCLYHPCKLHKAVDAMSCSEGHVLETLYLHAPFLMVVYTEVSILVVRRSDWNFTVSTFQIISLGKKTGTFVSATASPKVVLDERTKGVTPEILKSSIIRVLAPCAKGKRLDTVAPSSNSCSKQGPSAQPF